MGTDQTFRSRRGGHGAIALIVGGVVAAGVGVGCSGDRASPARVFLDVPFDTLFTVGTAVDSVLLMPHQLRPWRDGVVVFDFEASRVVAIDGVGRVAWTFHRPGLGPGEVSGPADGFAHPDGRVSVVDASNHRLVTLTADGQFESATRLDGLNSSWIQGIAPLPSDQALVLPLGMRVGRVDLANMQSVDELSLELSQPTPPEFRGMLTLSSDLRTGRWAVGMRFGPDWWVGKSGGELHLRSLIHETDYAVRGGSREVGDGVRLAISGPPSRHGAYSLAMHDDGYSILTGGGWGIDAPNDILDLYDDDGRYRASYRLPFSAQDHVWQGDRVFVLRLHPHPSILALRPRAP